MLMLVRGLPGSGKSTFAKVMAQIPNHVHLETDMFWGPDYKFDKNYLRQAHEWCQAETTRQLFLGRDVVVSNPFTTWKEVEPYLLIAKYAKTMTYLINMHGDFGSLHNVPREVIENMRARWTMFFNLEGWDAKFISS